MLHWAPMCSLWLRVPVLPMGPRAPASTLLCYAVFFGPNGLQWAPGGYLRIPHATLGSDVLPLAPGTCAPNGAACSCKHPAVLYRVFWAKWFAMGSRRLSKHPACYTGLRCAPSGSGYLCSQWGRGLLEAPCCVIPCSLGQMVCNGLQEAI